MSFINDHIDYITSLTDQSSELIEAIQAKNGTFVLYGNGNNGKSTFIKFLGKTSTSCPRYSSIDEMVCGWICC